MGDAAKLKHHNLKRSITQKSLSQTFINSKKANSAPSNEKYQHFCFNWYLLDGAASEAMNISRCSRQSTVEYCYDHRGICLKTFVGTMVLGARSFIADRYLSTWAFMHLTGAVWHGRLEFLLVFRPLYFENSQKISKNKLIFYCWKLFAGGGGFKQYFQSLWGGAMAPWPPLDPPMQYDGAVIGWTRNRLGVRSDPLGFSWITSVPFEILTRNLGYLSLHQFYACMSNFGWFCKKKTFWDIGESGVARYP